MAKRKTPKGLVCDMFHHEVMQYRGCVLIMDCYKERFPRYDCYYGKRWIGCTNASCEASWKANCRGIIEHFIKWAGLNL